MKMKRNQVKMTVDKAHKEISRELAVRAQLYPKWIQSKKLAQITAAERYVALSEIKDLLQLMKNKGVSFEELTALLNSLMPTPQPSQGTMKFGKSNYSPKNPT